MMSRSTDFVVIGSGVAGLRAAIELSRVGQVTVLTKDRLDESNTEYAQGGVAVALSDEDESGLHIEDTLVAGAGLCDEAAVRVLVEDGPGDITELIEWGANFDREDGALAFTREAAHSRRRILHARGDSTGSEIVRALLAHAGRRPEIEFHPHAVTTRLLVADGQCRGIRYIDTVRREERELTARAVILATGGAGQIYAQTTNPEVATGDGIILAWEAGALVADLEFVQFHPTALALTGAPCFLLSEALRGEGGRLRNHRGETFMERYDPRGELAPRDIVSRAIRAEMDLTGDRSIYLDLTHLDGQFLRARFPKIYRTCRELGLDLTRDPLPVSPAAHYMMGGVRTDIHGRTTLPGLYAAGEVACSGVHGANRLASNSLLEGLVFGARAGRAAAAEGKAPAGAPRPAAAVSADWRIDPQLKAQVQDLMWRKVGLIREGAELTAAIAELEQLAQRAHNLRSRNFALLGGLIAAAALWREESRGGHYRRDFPTRDDQRWRVHSGQVRDREIAGLVVES